jgi:hypothetical protein
MSGKYVLLSAVTASLALGSMSANAVAMRPGKTTDSSVCDLGPNTTRFIASQTLVPAAAQARDKIAAYVRLAGTFVTEQCANGQVLILHGSTDVDSDSPALDEVASSACRVADIRRSEGQASDGPYTYGTFELRCMISKLDEFKAKLRELESKDPIEALKGRLAGAARGDSSAAGGATSSKKDCDRMTLGTILQGGACK